LPVTPVQCLSYTLAQPGVSTALPGVKDVDELRAALAYCEASAEERDFSAALPQFQEGLEGTCVYCNHCLPCPVGIDVGRTLQALATAQDVGLEAARAYYDALPVPPSECIECGACAARCPFHVAAPDLIAEAADLFGG
jgi:predicted aldo/keto reductase-like oxidoreductase